jgi:hypothetical protein
LGFIFLPEKGIIGPRSREKTKLHPEGENAGWGLPYVFIEAVMTTVEK